MPTPDPLIFFEILFKPLKAPSAALDEHRFRDEGWGGSNRWDGTTFKSEDGHVLSTPPVIEAYRHGVEYA